MKINLFLLLFFCAVTASLYGSGNDQQLSLDGFRLQLNNFETDQSYCDDIKSACNQLLQQEKARPQQEQDRWELMQRLLSAIETAGNQAILQEMGSQDSSLPKVQLHNEIQLCARKVACLQSLEEQKAAGHLADIVFSSLIAAQTWASATLVWNSPVHVGLDGAIKPCMKIACIGMCQALVRHVNTVTEKSISKEMNNF